MQHFKDNLYVSGYLFLMSIFHLIHAFLPFRWTRHESWGLHISDVLRKRRNDV